MSSILKNADEILIELSNVFLDQIEICNKILEANHFVLQEKFNTTDEMIPTNQIWKK
jgi:hypothetical protein